MGTRKSISEAVRDALNRSGWGIRALSRETGIDHAQLSRFAAGTRALGQANLDRLADALNLEVVERREPKTERKQRQQ